MESDCKKKGRAIGSYPEEECENPMETRLLPLEERMMLGLDEEDKVALRDQAHLKAVDADEVVVRLKQEAPRQEAPAQDFTDRNILYATEAAGYLRISYQTILELIRKKQIPFKKVGRRYLFRREDLDKWLANR